MMNIPQQDEFVIATVKKIMPYGAFCILEEYPGIEAFVHISEVAPRWIKNIHEFLHEGQKVVARVYRLVPEKNQIDLSLKRVTEAERKRKLESVKRTKRAEKLLSMVQKSLKFGDAKKRQVTDLLLSSYEDMLLAFETAFETGYESLTSLGLEKEIAREIEEVAKKSIKKQKAEVRAILSLVSYEPNGVEIVKNALTGVVAPQNCEISLSFLGSPKYQLKVTAPDFKQAEKSLDAIALQIEKSIKGHEAVFTWSKVEE